MGAVVTQYKTVNIEDLRSLFGNANRQIEFLRRKQDNGKRGRFALLSDIASNIALISNECDLPAGYTDEGDPFACDALDVLRSEFAELRTGDYPVTDGSECLLNGKRLLL